MSKKIIFLSPYPFNQAPGQRFRYEQYLELLKTNGFEYELLSFLSPATNQILYKKGYTFKKIVGVLDGFLRRFKHLAKCYNADYVFIYREASPIGYPFYEWFLTKIMRKKIIYDFDDAIWLPVVSANNKLALHLKYANKVKYICKLAYKVSAGNDYLCANAKKFGAKIVVLNPTTIDTEKMHNQLKTQEKDRLTIGWTGTHSTLCYLNEIVPIIANLQKQFDFNFVVICNQNPQYDLKNYQYVEWKEATEISDLLQLHIGLMPLTFDAWAEGKCGFKALQYMALGIPAVVSPVGVNTKIVDDDVNGYICNNLLEWENKLTILINDTQKRISMGKAAREKILKEYSVQSNSQNFLNLFS